MEQAGLRIVQASHHPNRRTGKAPRPIGRERPARPPPTQLSTVAASDRLKLGQNLHKVDWGRNTLSGAVSPARMLKPTPQNRQVKLGKSNKSNLKQSESGKLNISRNDTVKISVNIKDQGTHNESMTLLEPLESKREITPAKSCISLKSSARLLPGVSTARLKLDDILTKKSNIKSFGRFRPMSEMEMQLSQSGLGGMACTFQSSQNVTVTAANGQQSAFTLDRIFSPEESQQRVYEEVGREIVNDLFSGYNGTLFAYGQTGSGKTHTMFGVVGESKYCGMIPRAVHDVFQHISADEQDKQYILTCSILEIYKETLFDLLVATGRQSGSLKIKESSSRGIYVEGLEEVPVTCEQQLIDLIVQANNNKSVRSTKMNEYSSRSHTIVMLEIVQRYSNGLQKKGRLNLVDLAGSQKVSKSGSVGQSLQEAKKINLSLSCLGNVIHALTSTNEHIPYRESKLTRLLQQSLGGNYKTYLVATCSPHSSNIQETLSTLKFASRVKTIKNSCKINVVNSTTTYKLLVGVQKQQIVDLTDLVKKLYAIYERLKQELMSKYQVLPASIGELLDEFAECYQSGFVRNVQNRNRLNQAFTNPVLMKSYGIKDAQQLSGLKSECQQALQTGVSTSQVSHNSSKAMLLTVPVVATVSPAFFKTSVSQDEQEKTQTECYAHKLELEEKDLTIKDLEGEVSQLRKKLLHLQNEVADLQQQKNSLEDSYANEVGKAQYGRFQTDVLQKQIESLMSALCRSDCSIGGLLAEKNALLNQKVEDALGKKLPFQQLKLGELLKITTPFFIGDSNGNKASEFKSVLDGALVKHTMLGQVSQFIDSDRASLVLKRDIAQALIINQHLVRLVAVLQWKHLISVGHDRLQSTLTANQQKTIQRLQKVISEATENHRLIREQIERLELEDCLRQKKSLGKQHAKESPRPYQRKTKILAPISKRTTQQLAGGKSPARDLLAKFNMEDIVPDLRNIRNVIGRVQQEILPVTYEGISHTLKQRNRLILTMYQQLINNDKLRQYIVKGYLSEQDSANSQSLKKENERLANKLLSIQSELHMETAKGEHFRNAYLLAQEQVTKVKTLSNDLEKRMQSILKQENDKWERTTHQLQSQLQLMHGQWMGQSYNASQRQSEGRPNSRRPPNHFQSHQF